MKSLNLLIVATLSLLILSATSCKKDETPSCTNGKQDGTETGIDCGGPCTVCTENINETYYFTGLVDGNLFTVQDSVFGSTAGYSVPGGNCQLSAGVVLNTLDSNSNQVNTFRFDFWNMQLEGACNFNDVATFNQIFEPGTYKFDGFNGPKNAFTSVYLYYNNQLYTNENVMAQPAISEYTIVESTPVPPRSINGGVRLKIRFSCVLKADNGDEISITNAETMVNFYLFEP